MDSVFEALLEVVLQVFGDAILDGLLRSKNPATRAIGTAIVAALFALILGVGSVVIFPQHMIRNQTVRIIALVLLPALNGLIMHKVGTYFAHRGKARSAFENVFPAAVFSLVFGLTRFLLAK